MRLRPGRAFFFRSRCAGDSVFAHAGCSGRRARAGSAGARLAAGRLASQRFAPKIRTGRVASRRFAPKGLGHTARARLGLRLGALRALFALDPRPARAWRAWTRMTGARSSFLVRSLCHARLTLTPTPGPSPQGGGEMFGAVRFGKGRAEGVDISPTLCRRGEGCGLGALRALFALDPRLARATRAWTRMTGGGRFNAVSCRRLRRWCWLWRRSGGRFRVWRPWLRLCSRTSWRGLRLTWWSWTR
jgi:hypothetical protein